MTKHNWWKMAALGALGCAWPAAARADEEVRHTVTAPQQDVLFLVDDETAPPAPEAGDDVILHLTNPAGDGERQVRRFLTLSDSGAPTGKYWIGVMCNPLDEAVRAQLTLDEGVGVIVGDVVPDSPAAKAGVQKFDVVVQAGELKLKDASELAKAVEANGTKELTLSVIRAGKPVEVTVTPAERENTETRRAGEAEERAVRILQRLQQEGNGPVMRLFHRGFVTEPPKMPENLNISIEKHGNAPAKIHVEQDGKSWDATEDKLDDLPEEVRGHVSRMLGHGGAPLDVFMPHQGEGGPAFDVKVLPPQVVPRPPRVVQPETRERMRTFTERVEGPAGDRLEKRLEQLNERLDRLQSLIEQMRKSDAPKDAPPTP